MENPKFGVLLINLGTPDEPTPTGIRRYLAEFLWDKRVVDSPRWLWWFVLNCVILRLRPRKITKLYQSIWGKDGSPLLTHTQSLAKRLEKQLANELQQSVPVVTAMTYGNPSIRAAGQQFRDANIQKIIVLPLYPQYSATTTAASFDALAKQLNQCPDLPELIFIRDYHQYPGYIDALKQTVLNQFEKTGMPDKLIMSFHGIPQRYHTQGDPYPTECQTTAELLAKALDLPQDKWALTYQSRVGLEEWLKPYTDTTMEALPQQGVKHISILCPGFAVDCLETLEEIDDQNKEIFLTAGGETFNYIPCLNASEHHVSFLKQLVMEKACAWTHTTKAL